MKIKTLILTSFGKFKDRVIEVDDGFNLVYGENEAGKSTAVSYTHLTLPTICSV